jgi:GT2 family glycosyltransferase
MPDHWGHGQQDDERWDERRDVDYVTGAAWGLRRDTLEQIGELDEGFWPGYYEEVDYCFRARETGLRIVYEPAAEAIHAESTTLGKGSERYLRAFHRGRLRFVLKRQPPERFLREFVPGERSWLGEELSRTERSAMSRAYRAAMLMVSTIYAAREKSRQPTLDSLRQVTEALASLQAQVWKPSDPLSKPWI